MRDLYGHRLLNLLSCLNDSRKAVKRPSANMAAVSCHLPAREHMARDTLVWWKQTQQGQSTSDRQTEAQRLIKNMNKKKTKMSRSHRSYKSRLMCFSHNGRYALNYKEFWSGFHLLNEPNKKEQQKWVNSPKPPKDDSSGHVFTGWVEAPVFKEIWFYLSSCLCLFLSFMIRPEVIPCVLAGFWCKEEL